MTVSKRLRFEILRRDNHACRYCGRSAPEVELTVDHVVPTTLGGGDEPSNLVAACRDCNSGKSSVSADAVVVDDVAQDAIRWARAMKDATRIDRRKRSSDHKFVADFGDRIATIINSDPGEHIYHIPDLSSAAVGGKEAFTHSVIRFRDCGLNLNDLEHAMRKASSRKTIRNHDRWHYFCGICWSIIRDRQKIAQKITTTEAD
jgi:hypothetical protein